MIERDDNLAAENSPGDPARETAQSTTAADVQRLTALEELFTHLQHTMQQLSDELLVQVRRLDALQRDVQRMTHRLDQVADSQTEPRNLLDEKPPHY